MSSKIKLVKKNIYATSLALLSTMTFTGCVRKYDGNSEAVISTKDIVYQNTNEPYNDIDNLYVIKTQNEDISDYYIIKKVKCDDIDNNTVDNVTFGSEYIEKRWKKLFLSNYGVTEINNNTYLYISVVNDEMVSITYNETDKCNTIQQYFGAEILEENKLVNYSNEYNLNQKTFTVEELKQLLDQIKIDNNSKVYTK